MMTSAVSSGTLNHIVPYHTFNRLGQCTSSHGSGAEVSPELDMTITVISTHCICPLGDGSAQLTVHLQTTTDLSTNLAYVDMYH